MTRARREHVSRLRLPPRHSSSSFSVAWPFGLFLWYPAFRFRSPVSTNAQFPLCESSPPLFPLTVFVIFVARVIAACLTRALLLPLSSHPLPYFSHFPSSPFSLVTSPCTLPPTLVARLLSLRCNF